MPNRSCTFVATMALATTLALGCLAAAYGDPVSTPDENAEPSSTSTEASSGQTPAEGDAESSGPEPFVPTEKISADSAVSFPVDI